MKKNYLFLLMSVLCFQAKAQIVNESANWPNPAWTITGDYNTGPTAFESDPTTTANFAFDDDDATNGHDDSIAAESPVINLAAAFNGNEKFITATAQYGYHYLANDVLIFQYWDADAGAWVNWGASIPGNNTAILDNFCTIPKTSISSGALSIGSFTANQLANFKYRISYDDQVGGPDWNYGFCFESPVLTSSACGAPSAIVFSNVMANTVDVAWSDLGVPYEYVVDGVATDPAGAGTANATNSVSVGGLTQLTPYYFHVRAVCAPGVFSAWTTTPFTTSPDPAANDDCANAIELTVNPDFACGTVTAGTLLGATDSGETDNGAGTPDDDVWYTFVASATSQKIVISNVSGTPTDLVFEVLDGGCGAFTSLLISDPNTNSVGNLIPGNTYYIRVFSYTAGGSNSTTTFNICVGTPPPAAANDDCTMAEALTVNPDTNCASVTSGTLQSASDSGEGDNGAGTPDDDVWYTFVATNAIHTIKLSNIVGSSTDLVHEVLSGNCGGFTSLSISDPNTSSVANLNVGETYYIRVFTLGATPADTTFDICVGTPPPPPVNDDIAGAIQLTLDLGTACGPNKITGISNDQTSGSPEIAPTCTDQYNPSQGNGDLWYYIVAPSPDFKLNISDITGSIVTVSSALYSGTPGNLTEVGVCGNAATKTYTGLNVGETYYFRVWDYANDGIGTFSLCGFYIDCTPHIATYTVVSDCPNTETFSVNVEITGMGSATSITISDDQGSATQQAAAPGIYTFGPYANGTPVIFTSVNDASAACTLTSPVQNQVACPGPNDECANAIALIPAGSFDAAAVIGNNTGATHDANDPLPTCDALNFATNGKDVWYSVVVPASGTLTLETRTAGDTNIDDTGIQAFSGSCGALTALGCNADNGDGNFSLLPLTGLNAGETILVRVWGYNTDFGAFNVAAYDASLGILPNSDDAFRVYPNPVHNVLNLEYAADMSEVAVYNVIGQQVLTKTLNTSSAQVDMSNLASGTYIVKVMADNKVKTIKVVKQ
ncbi:T9SS type A sorting domain-containing protein [Flavobacterium pallidum]|uniref:Fibronectin type-III domain-containing protein n=1 Tax=Flavobacterium pallidum TaxID=2172098 RepID=A0A2S1SHS9_9FLAO|nr:T9SS type A sorting domain-containing protein [Flavobacterium pallidum]AWI25963.1 hypothetical protein HYN49_08655 [Flavobacterium pallidum]